MQTTKQSPITHRAVQRFRGEKSELIEDALVVEEPLEIRIAGRRYTATMRTPGEDRLLTQGLLFSEGVIQDLDDIERMDVRLRCREENKDLVNVVDVILHDESQIPAALWERSLISNSSCGLCGKASVEALTARTTPLTPHFVPMLALPTLADKLKGHQALFSQTGGLHGVGLFNDDGLLLAAYEDIGRHNATDKVLGWALEWNLVPADAPLILLVSGRASFEIVQKALVARIQTVASISAASSLAVDLAAANNMNLVGFLRPNGFTIYTGTPA